MQYLRIALATLLSTSLASDAAAETLNLDIGGETGQFEITYCQTDSRPSGQLVLEAEITAVGRFRGRPAVLLLAKVAGADPDPIDLYLVELPAAVRAAAPFTVLHHLQDAYQAEYSQRFAGINEEYSHERLEALPPDQMMVKFEELGAKTEALDKEMEALRHKIRSFGTISVDGSRIGFEGSDTRVIRGKEALTGVSGTTRIEARCGD